MPSSSRPPKGGFSQHDIHPVGLGIADIGSCKSIVVTDKGWVFNAMEQHVRNTEHVRELFFLCCPQALLHLLFIFWLLDITLAHVMDCAGEKAACSTGGIEENLSWFRVYAVYHERCHSTRGIILSGISRTLEVIQDLLVDIPEVLALLEIVEVH